MKKKILIIEDEKGITEFLKILLEKNGFVVETLESGKEAFKKIEEFKPNFIILDVVLPHLSGLEILSWTKEKYPNIKIILATAKESLEDLKKSFFLDADYYLIKPYAKEEILKAVFLLNTFKD